MRFTDHSDPSAAYMFHCHLLRHEDEGMMGQFVVVRRGEQAPGVRPVSGRGNRGDEYATRVELVRSPPRQPADHAH